jgi:metaxin
LTSTSTPSPLPITPTSALGPELTLRQDPYLSLLSGPIRAAWLTALYLDPANAPLLEALYIAPASSSPIVRAALLRQLRQAAESEVVRILYPTSSSSSGGWKLSVNGFLEFGPGATRKPAAVVDYKEIYDRAEKAWESLAELLAESETGWFFGVEKPGVFDAAVFAYSHLVENRESQEGEEGKGLRWRDGGRLDGMVRGAGRGELIEHRERIWEMCWGGDREGWKGE